MSPGTVRDVRLTVMERLVGFVPVRYWASCLILSFLVGPPMQFISALADTGSLDRAFLFTFNPSTGASGEFTTSTLGIVFQLTWTLNLFVVYYLPRFMRTRLTEYESHLAPVSSGGVVSIARHFDAIYRFWPVIVLAAVLSTLSWTYVSLQLVYIVGVVSLSYLLLSNGLVMVIFSGFIWVYFSALWGLYKLGKEPLMLKSVDADVMLGLRPIGSISFSLFLAFISVVVLSLIGVLVNPDTVSLASLFVLALLGGVMFFLPLNSFHKQMLAVRRKEEGDLFQRLAEMSNRGEGGAEQEVDLLRSIRDVQLLQMRKDRLSKVPTWPFDTQLFGRFAAIILSVTAILLSRIISVFLHI